MSPWSAMNHSNKLMPILLLIWIVSLLTRIYKISQPALLVWDEVHFIKFVSRIQSRTFFFDVHPPLGKLLLAGFSRFLNLTFETNPKSGDPYLSNDYVYLRSFCAVTGSFIPTAVSAIVYRVTNRSILASFMAGLWLALDSALITISQYILLDSFLLLFQSLVLLNYLLWKESPEASRQRLTTVLCVGFYMFLMISVKLSGLLTAAIIYLDIVRGFLDRWISAGGKEMDRATIFGLLKWILVSGLTFAAVPFILYVCLYVGLFQTIHNSGSDDGMMSAPFQAGLRGNKFNHEHQQQQRQQCATVMNNSVLTLKNGQMGGSYLHSHPEPFPGHIQQVGGVTPNDDLQQVSGYSYQDDNNLWRIRFGGKNLFSLQHVQTELYLSIFNDIAPLSRKQFLVGATQRLDSTMEYSSIWKFKSISHLGASSSHVEQKMIPRIQTLKTKFQVYNYAHNCFLRQNLRELPNWGHRQHEITCSRHSHLPAVFEWIIDENMVGQRDCLEFLDYHDLKLSVWSKFMEYHRAVSSANSQMVARDGDVIQSPINWMFNYPGQVFSVWERFVKMNGNRALWRMNAFVLLCYPMISFTLKIIRKRQIALGVQNPIELPDSLAGDWDFIYIGWLMNYVPYFFMTRILYFHHYLSAHLFATILTVSCVDSCLKTTFLAGSRFVKIGGAWICLTGMVLQSFIAQFDVTYGKEIN